MTLAEFGTWAGICGSLVGIGVILVRTGRLIQRVDDMIEKLTSITVRHERTEGMVGSLAERLRAVEVACGERHGKPSGVQAHG